MIEKKTLRNELKVRRKFDNPESKAFADGNIVSVFLASEQYHESSSLLIYVSVGDEIYIFGFPHCTEGRRVLTFQKAMVGAKVLINSSGIKSKYCVINTGSGTFVVSVIIL